MENINSKSTSFSVFKVIKRLGGLFLKNHRELKKFFGQLDPNDDYYYRYFGRQDGKIQRSYVTNLIPEISKIDEIKLVNTFMLNPGTSLEYNELSILIALVKFFKPSNLVEVGTFNGVTSHNIAVNCPETSIFTLDLPQDFIENLPGIPSEDSNVTDRNIVGESFKELVEQGEISNINQHFGNSLNYNWKDFQVKPDFVFIDGCHHYKYVKKDTENALENLSDNGIIVWHDYGQLEGVTQYLDELSEKLDLYAIKSTRHVIYSKKNIFKS